MAIPESERLRQLVSDYYHGLITQESYRERRTTLLDNIGAGVSGKPETTARKAQLSSEEPAQVRPQQEQQEEPTGSGFRPGSLAVGAIVLVGIVAGAYVIFVQDSGTGPAEGSTNLRGETVEERSSDFGDAIVEEFLSRDEWTIDSLNNFLLAWGALDDGQRQRSVEGRLYRRLRIRLHQRIREQALLGDASGDGRLRALTGFAAKIGAPYRESRTADADELTAAEVMPDSDTNDEREVLTTNSDGETAALTEHAAAEAEAAEAPTLAADETEGPVDETPAESDSQAPPTTEMAAMKDDPCPYELANTRTPYCQDKLLDGGVGPPLVVLPTGTYKMGSDNFDSETPPHQVDISYHLAISRHEITAEEFAQFCSATSLPCSEQRWAEDAPVVSVSWDDAVQYAEWLSEATGFKYRLPTEAEWEFAARAGTQSPYYFGDEITPSAAYSSANGPADSPLPRSDRRVNRNPFRLYHMSGNVREWVQDTWYENYENAPRDGRARLLETEDLRAVRGGSYADPATKLRSAAREPLQRSHRDDVTGIRIVRELGE